MYNFLETVKCLNGYQLKKFAIIIMIIDHIGVIFFPANSWIRLVGRLAFPIFAFFIAEGMVYTRDAKKYLMRLGIFALISEVPFDLAFHNSIWYTDGQNVFFTLFLGAAGIYLYQKMHNKTVGILLAAFVALLATYLYVDYGTLGVLLIIGFYFARNNLTWNLWVLAGINFCFGWIQNYATFAIIPIAMYNGEKGNGKLGKYFFYGFYPIHLLVLKGIWEFLL